MRVKTASMVPPGTCWAAGTSTALVSAGFASAGLVAAGWFASWKERNTPGAGLVRLGDQGLEGCALASGGGNNLDEHRYVDAGDDIHALAGGRELAPAL